MEDTRKKRGGARAGAGRPKGEGDSRMVSFRAPGALADSLDSMPDRSGFIRHSLTEAVRRQKEAETGLGEIIPVAGASSLVLPYFDVRVVAGFPVPLDNDERSQDIDVLSMLCPHPESSYLVRVKGDSMIDAGIANGDIVIVDKSRRDPSPKEIAVCELNGEFTLKRFVKEGDQGWLIPANPDYPRFPITPEDDFSVWGVVTYIIHKAKG